MKAYWGSEGITPHILDLGSSWRWVVSSTPWPFYTQGKSPWYPLDRRLGVCENKNVLCNFWYSDEFHVMLCGYTKQQMSGSLGFE
jgi:hypothetical protein